MFNIGLQQVRSFTIFTNRIQSLNTNQIYRIQTSSRHNQNKIMLSSVIDSTKLYLTKFVDGCRIVIDSNEYNIAKEFLIKSSKWSYKQIVAFYEKNIEKRDDKQNISANNKVLDENSGSCTQKSLSVCDSKNFIAVKNIKNTEINNKEIIINNDKQLNLNDFKDNKSNNIKLIDSEKKDIK